MQVTDSPRYQSADWYHPPHKCGGRGRLRRQSAKFQFVAPQNDTERVRVKTITDHVRHDLAARPAGKFQFSPLLRSP